MVKLMRHQTEIKMDTHRAREIVMMTILIRTQMQLKFVTGRITTVMAELMKDFQIMIKMDTLSAGATVMIQILLSIREWKKSRMEWIMIVMEK